MKTRNRISKGLALVALAVSLVVIAAVWRVGRVAAIGNPDIRSSGLFSLAPGQTARLSVLNPVLAAPPDPDTPARRVRLAFDIYFQAPPDPDSPAPRLNNFRFLRRVSRDAMLRPGEAASFDFTATATGTPISAVMLGGPDTSPGIGDPDIVPTLEVMEGGRTVFTHPALARGFSNCVAN